MDKKVEKIKYELSNFNYMMKNLVNSKISVDASKFNYYRRNGNPEVRKVANDFFNYFTYELKQETINNYKKLTPKLFDFIDLLGEFSDVYNQIYACNVKKKYAYSIRTYINDILKQDSESNDGRLGSIIKKINEEIIKTNEQLELLLKSKSGNSGNLQIYNLLNDKQENNYYDIFEKESDNRTKADIRQILTTQNMDDIDRLKFLKAQLFLKKKEAIAIKNELYYIKSLTYEINNKANEELLNYNGNYYKNSNSKGKANEIFQKLYDYISNLNEYETTLLLSICLSINVVAFEQSEKYKDKSWTPGIIKGWLYCLRNYLNKESISMFSEDNKYDLTEED